MRVQEAQQRPTVTACCITTRRRTTCNACPILDADLMVAFASAYLLPKESASCLSCAPAVRAYTHGRVGARHANGWRRRHVAVASGRGSRAVPKCSRRRRPVDARAQLSSLQCGKCRDWGGELTNAMCLPRKACGALMASYKPRQRSRHQARRAAFTGRAAALLAPLAKQQHPRDCHRGKDSRRFARRPITSLARRIRNADAARAGAPGARAAAAACAGPVTAARATRFTPPGPFLNPRPAQTDSGISSSASSVNSPSISAS